MHIKGKCIQKSKIVQNNSLNHCIIALWNYSCTGGLFGYLKGYLLYIVQGLYLCRLHLILKPHVLNKTKQKSVFWVFFFKGLLVILVGDLN